MPGMLSPEEQVDAQQRSLGTTAERMLREIVDVLETLAGPRLLLLLLEDLHWSDHATLDLLSSLARRQEPARLMIVASYRPGDARATEHPLDRLKHDLRVRSLCHQLAVPPLPLAAVRGLLLARLGTRVLPDGLAEAIHQRTDGNALYLTALVEEFGSDGLSALALSPAESLRARAIDVSLPSSLRLLIEQQLERLGTEALSMIEAASVSGPEFSCVEVAAAAGESIEAVEAHAETLARRGTVILRMSGVPAEWPDGSVGGRYGFVRGLYQEVLYQRLTPGQKARLHQRVGRRLEAAYGSQAPFHATELARHYTEGRDAERAVHYLQLAADQAKARGAYKEGVLHLSHALKIVRDVKTWRAERPGRWRCGLRSALPSWSRTVLVTKPLSMSSRELWSLRTK